jgi:hypothetical protein
MTLSPETIEHIDREFIRDQERDRMNERTQQIWPIFLSMSTVFGFIGLQNGEGAYLIGIFPVLVNCLAQHVHDSEQTLKKGRKYLYKQEQDAGCTTGAESYFRNETSKGSGGNKKALRRAFFATSALATFLFVRRLSQNQVPLPMVVTTLCIEILATLQTVYWLTYWKPIIIWWKRLTRNLLQWITETKAREEKDR